MDYRKYTAELFLVKVRQYYMNALLEEEWEELSRKIWVYLPTYIYLYTSQFLISFLDKAAYFKEYA